MRLDRRQAFAIAGVLALIAAALVYYVLSSASRAHEPQKPETTVVVVAATNIPPYTKVTPGMVETKEVPVVTAPGNALKQTGEAVGKVTQYAISKGQMLVRGDVLEPGAAQGLTFVIPKGKRAVTVALDVTSVEQRKEKFLRLNVYPLGSPLGQPGEATTELYEDAGVGQHQGDSAEHRGAGHERADGAAEEPEDHRDR